MKVLVWILKKSELLSALSIRLVYLTGKSKVPIHPKHLVNDDLSVYNNIVKKGDIVLDVGCGSGQHSIRLAKIAKKVVGVDKDEKSLEIARKNALSQKIKNIDFVYSNVEKKLAFKNNSFDSAILIDVLEHINKRTEFLKEIKRVVKRTGQILIIIPNKDTSWKRLQRKYGIQSYSDPDHKIEYTRKTIARELNRAGIKIVKILPHTYDTPWIGIIDLIGGISLPLYIRLRSWRKKMEIKYPENCAGFLIVGV